MSSAWASVREKGRIPVDRQNWTRPEWSPPSPGGDRTKARNAHQPPRRFVLLRHFCDDAIKLRDRCVEITYPLAGGWLNKNYHSTTISTTAREPLLTRRDIAVQDRYRLTREQPDGPEKLPASQGCGISSGAGCKIADVDGWGDEPVCSWEDCRPTCTFSIRSDRRVFFDQTDPAGTASAQHSPAARSESPRKAREA